MSDSSGTQTAVKVRHQCSDRVYRSGSVRGTVCAIPATVQRDVPRTEYPIALKMYDEATFTFIEVPQPARQVVEPKWFCGIHDPVAWEWRESKKREARQLERDVKHAREERSRQASADHTAKVKAVLDAARELVAAEDGSGRFPTLTAAVAALDGKRGT